jgi:predicted Zn finger-like uncharacterized protein
MSLKTRCPACDTVFKIVPDQLKVSNGWVRCGRCAEVFDAAAHVVSSAAEEATDKTDPWQQVSVPEVPSPGENTQITPENIAPQAINTPANATFTPPADKTETDLSFIRVAKNKAFWKKRSVITSLRAACAALAGLLFFQVVFNQRNHLAAANPALATSFESVCKTLGCKIESFKNIDAFKIDSSSFQKAPIATGDSTSAEVFALKLSLKNSSDMPVAMPAVELTLTEAGDKPVLRRVLLAKDLGFSEATLAANAEWNGEMKLAVTSNPTMVPISGYRVLLFYP